MCPVGVGIISIADRVKHDNIEQQHTLKKKKESLSCGGKNRCQVDELGMNRKFTLKLQGDITVTRCESLVFTSCTLVTF